MALWQSRRLCTILYLCKYICILYEFAGSVRILNRSVIDLVKRSSGRYRWLLLLVQYSKAWIMGGSIKLLHDCTSLCLILSHLPASVLFIVLYVTEAAFTSFPDTSNRSLFYNFVYITRPALAINELQINNFVDVS